MLTAPTAAAALLALSVVLGCSGGDTDPAGIDAGPRVVRPAGWTEATHGKGTGPRHDRALPQGEVSRIDLRIAPADWAAMHADMTDMLGDFNSGGLVQAQPGTVTLVPRDPIFVPATVTFAGKAWHHVGVRFRGNASLAHAWKRGKSKLPFKLDFDELEDRFPEIADQRFFGLKGLALINNWGDDALVREKVATDLFRAAGVPAGPAAFFRVYVDHGAGPVYFGLYTGLDMPSKPMLKATFGDDEGNLYKPDGDGAKLVTFDARAFEKKTNEGRADFADVQALLAALHASRTDAAAWRAGLDRVLDTSGFLRWLAANTVMTNWDTYGNLPHNYYLYGVPREAGRFHWIPWDNTESFKRSAWLFFFPALTPSLDEVKTDWPLIRYTLDDPTYRATYYQHMRAFLNGPFALATITAKIRAEHALIAPHVVGADGERAPYTLLAKPEDFAKELEAILSLVRERHELATKAVTAPR